jgi:adenylate cyclase
MSEGTQRRLAAVLAADVVGYSRLMGEDEAGTLAALRNMRSGVLEPTVQTHRGKIVKNMGDGWIASFASAGDAVGCAIRIQEELSDQDTLKLRIGIHVGDVTEADSDVYGDGVNIAARLQDIAEPGAIAISDMVRRSIDGKLAGAFNDIGMHELKNIADPVAAFGWRMTKVAETKPTLAAPANPSIVVLPFSNMSGDPDQDYFSDGVSEDLTTALSRFDWLFVIARNSAFTYKDQSVDVKRIAQELGVRYVLEGSVRRAGDRVRVNAQLIDADVDRHVWAERFDRQVDDIFELQDDIVARIASSVGPEITLAEIARAHSRRPDTLDTWQLYLQALAAFHHMTEEKIGEAVSLLKQAIELEPDFANAYALLGHCHVHRGLNGWAKPAREALEEGLRYSEQGVRLAPTNPEVHHALSFALRVTGQTRKSITAARRAIELNPNYSEAYASLGHSLIFNGDIEEGLAACRVAERSSPRDTRGNLLYDAIGHAYFMLGDYEQAIEVSIKCLQQDPSQYGALVTLAGSYAYLGREVEAKENIDELLRLIPRYSLSALRKNPMFVQPEHIDKLVEGLRLAGLPE